MRWGSQRYIQEQELDQCKMVSTLNRQSLHCPLLRKERQQRCEIRPNDLPRVFQSIAVEVKFSFLNPLPRLVLEATATDAKESSQRNPVCVEGLPSSSSRERISWIPMMPLIGEGAMSTRQLTLMPSLPSVFWSRSKLRWLIMRIPYHCESDRAFDRSDWLRQFVHVPANANPLHKMSVWGWIVQYLVRMSLLELRIWCC